MKEFKMKGHGGKDGPDLDQLHIRQKDGNTGYSVHGVMTETSDTQLPVTLPPFHLNGWEWYIIIDTVSMTGMTGRWRNNDTDPEEEDGTWQTSSGGGVDTGKAASVR